MKQFFAGLATRTAEIQSRCRHKLHVLAEAVVAASPESLPEALHTDPIGASA